METLDVLRTPAVRAPIPALPSQRETRDIVRPSRPPSAPPPAREELAPAVSTSSPGLSSSAPPASAPGSSAPGPSLSASVPPTTTQEDSAPGLVPWASPADSAEGTTDRFWEPYRGPYPFWVRGGRGFALGPCSCEEAVITLRASRMRSTIEVSGDGERWMPAPRFSELTGEEPRAEAPLGARLWAGKLEETSTVALLGRLAMERATGRLEIRRRTDRGEEHATLHLTDGLPARIATNARGFTLYEIILAEGDISPDDIAACMHAVVTTGRPLEELACEQKCVDLESVRPRVMKARLAMILGWDWGAYAFSAEPPRPEVPFVPALLPLVPRLLARARTADRLRVELGPVLDARFDRTERFEEILDLLELDPVEREGIAPFGATRSLREAILYSDAGDRFALTMAFVLKELGALRVVTSAPSRA